MQSQNEEMQAILDAMTEENCLSVEIIWSAMLHLKAHPECSIVDAIDVGFNEWVK